MGPHSNPWHHEKIRRRFIDVPAGQVHLRCSREPTGDEPPLLMLHASPASSNALVPLIVGLGEGRQCYAPDTLGFGDSSPPLQETPEAADYAAVDIDLLDALGLSTVDVYGSHTGAHIAVELAIAAPERVRRIILDGIALFEPAEKARVLEHYAPAIKPDVIGSQLNWAWHFVRDQAVYFPYFDRDAEHLRGVGMVSPEALHFVTVDVLKALTTYHLGYRAAFRHADRERLPRVGHRTLVTADASDPLSVSVPIATSLLPDSISWISASQEEADALDDKIKGLDGFLRTGEI